MLRKIKNRKKGTGYFFIALPASFKKVACPLFSAILLILAFPNPQISVLAWVAFIPIFLAIDTVPLRKSFFLSYLAGVLFYGGVLYWLTHVTKLGYAVLVFYLALYFGAFGLLTNIFLNKLRASRLNFLSFLILPSVWVALEFLRGVLFTGFPWAILGYTQYRNPVIIQISDITGSYGTSFLIIMVNFIFYAHLSRILKRTANYPALRFQTAASMLILAAVLFYGYKEFIKDDFKTGLRLSVVQGNITQEHKWDPAYKEFILSRYENLTKEAAKEKSRLIIWPETAVPGYLGEGDIDIRLKNLIKETGVPLFLGAVTYEVDFAEGEEYFYNSAVLYSPDGDIIKGYDKLHLVPFGEYVPFERYFPFIRKLIDVEIGDYRPGAEYTVFDIYEESAHLRYAALICFEDIFPGLCREFAQKGADLLVNITNDAWFEESGEQLQHAQASVFRAVENRVGVLRAANTGFSCYINPRGVIEDSIFDRKKKSMYIEGFNTFDIKVSPKCTFYTRFGDIFAYLCLFIVLGAAIPLFFVDFFQLRLYY